MRPFRVDLFDIVKSPGTSLDVTGEIELDGFDKGGDRVELTGPAAMDLVVENVGDGAFILRGRLTAGLALFCGRCLKPFALDVKPEVEALFRSAAVFGEESYPVDGNQLDIAPALTEALVLEVPYAAVCEESCQGLCPVCGADMHEAPCACEIESSDPRLARLKDWMEQQGR